MQRNSLQRAWGQTFTEGDAVLTPTWTQLPFAHGYDVSSVSAAGNVLELMRPVMPGNALGLPSAAGLFPQTPIDPVTQTLNERKALI